MKPVRKKSLAALLMAITAFEHGGSATSAADRAPAGAGTGTGTGTGAEVAGAPLGVSYAGWKGGYRDAIQRLAAFKDIGFRIVSFVPTYSYVGLDRIDMSGGPEWNELARAVEAALRGGFQVVLKPHLDPLLYQSGFDPYATDNHSWRVHAAWRGFFDLDPMTNDYRHGVVAASLKMLRGVFDNLARSSPAARFPPVRMELGAELMNSVVYGAEGWEKLLLAAKLERRRLGLDRQVLLSHNFTHHFEILDDFVGRMSPPRRASLRKYIAGLDAVAVSQYMDLTAAMPAAERGRRLPTPDEVAEALVLHERNFRRDILEGALGMRPGEVPPLHIGEFGVGRGGLRNPNLWSGTSTAAEEKSLAREIARGHEGLLRYLGRANGRTAESAVLWVLGPHYDIFGWGDPKLAIPEAAAVIRAGMRSSVGTGASWVPPAR
jgi:hypothetical protein